MLDFERSPGRCPSCGRECPKHDHRERTWRDLDFCWDQFLHALVPRVDCAEHGVVTVVVTWSARRSEFTESFERITIALIREMSVAAVSRRMAVSWDQVDVVMMRAVERGRTRQQPRLVKTSVSTRRQSRRAIATSPSSPISMRASCFSSDMAASVRRSTSSGPGFRAKPYFDSTMAPVRVTRRQRFGNLSRKSNRLDRSSKGCALDRRRQKLPPATSVPYASLNLRPDTMLS